MSEPHCVHLLEAHSAELLAECHAAGLYLALCGEELATGSCLMPSVSPPVCQRETVYCLEYIRAANQHNLDAGGEVDCPPGVIVRTGR